MRDVSHMFVSCFPIFLGFVEMALGKEEKHSVLKELFWHPFCGFLGV